MRTGNFFLVFYNNFLSFRLFNVSYMTFLFELWICWFFLAFLLNKKCASVRLASAFGCFSFETWNSGLVGLLATACLHHHYHHLLPLHQGATPPPRPRAGGCAPTPTPRAREVGETHTHTQKTLPRAQGPPLKYSSLNSYWEWVEGGKKCRGVEYKTRCE